MGGLVSAPKSDGPPKKQNVVRLKWSRQLWSESAPRVLGSTVNLNHLGVNLGKIRTAMSNVLLTYNFRFAVGDCSEDLVVLIHY